ncbi:hypothetical protein [Alkalihalobacterium chitinilyticum]|uniref:Uncharacterized protein n=1 Tax=Alkalihalobacterium chitinilyticum TaxID=2980103 RepID=A0ABT5VB79_9BACI|nr:hypothetical protein [Alkalihalobacterium chitinilyticum]MDE5412729.1 hypothetical protein [Alkalihalobacterium chitinilyticum]
MVFVLPFIFVIFGFIFAFIGGTISNQMNHVPFYQMIDEILFYFQSILTGAGQASFVFSFDIIHEFLIPGSLYFLATACLVSACKMLYQQIEAEKLEESFLRIAIMTVIGLMTIVLFYKGGATLLIISVCFVFVINIYQWLKFLFVKTVQP